MQAARLRRAGAGTRAAQARGWCGAGGTRGAGASHSAGTAAAQERLAGGAGAEHGRAGDSRQRVWLQTAARLAAVARWLGAATPRAGGAERPRRAGEQQRGQARVSGRAADGAGARPSPGGS
jgi:hypothetical protein